MQDIKQQLTDLQTAFEAAWKSVGVDKLISQHAELATQISAPDFWQDSQRAQTISQKHSNIGSRIEPWTALKKDIEESLELSAMNDNSLADDLRQAITRVDAAFVALKKELMFSGPYDEYDVILSIHSGAGGTDAQDWAEMLERMYLRFFEKNKWRVSVIDRSAGEEAGIKSVSLIVEGKLVYGKLKSEHGVHRLVRLSPFNADSLRQTSFARVEVVPKIDKPEDVEIDEKDLRIDVYRSGGKGGQSVNTTDSAVRITHEPTGITVAIQNERSQLQNKETAMTILRSKLAQLKLEQHKEKIEELRGPNEQAAWGNQIRSYVLHPYKMIKDLRSSYETSDTDGVLAGDIDQFITAFLEHELGR